MATSWAETEAGGEAYIPLMRSEHTVTIWRDAERRLGANEGESE